MEHLATLSSTLIAALPVSLILVIGSAWWIFRR
jgi:hypothetical protein